MRRPKLTAMEAEHRAEVIGAYTASVRLELYARFAFLLALLAFVALFGAMIVGWMDVDRGVVLLSWALLLAVATAAKIYDESIGPASAPPGWSGVLRPMRISMRRCR